jgi:L-seryl-tRNA(Ser) seleniumtransferase
MPLSVLPSSGIAIASADPKAAGRLLNGLSAALRRLEIPVIGRIDDQALVLDLRCLEDDAAFLRNLSTLDPEGIA